MIITRSPLRISLGGGGTDLPSYYREHGGFLIAAAIDRYVYINVHQRFVDGFLLKYSELEETRCVDDIRHPIIREALRFAGVRATNLEIASMADIPAGTGLGSSGSFTTALLQALHAHEYRAVDAPSLAEQACEIEIERLGEPIGKQDQYIAAIGGITAFDFHPDGHVTYRPVTLADTTRRDLEEHLLLFFTGYSRSASNILRDQKARSENRDAAMLENLHFIKQLGRESLIALERGNLHEFARLMNVHWERKRTRSEGMSNERINDLYALARKNGALGGKLIGAGGGGFLMFYAEDDKRLRSAMTEAGLREVRFRFDDEGTKVLCRD
jgi:D-glycero-alpha-D-manno-heptose-7-phosphate kinase